MTQETIWQMFYNSIVKGWKCAFTNCKISDSDMDKIKNPKLIYHIYCQRCGGSLLVKQDEKPDYVRFVNTEQYAFDEWWDIYMQQQPDNSESYIK